MDEILILYCQSNSQQLLQRMNAVECLTLGLVDLPAPVSSHRIHAIPVALIHMSPLLILPKHASEHHQFSPSPPAIGWLGDLKHQECCVLELVARDIDILWQNSAGIAKRGGVVVWEDMEEVFERHWRVFSS